MSVKLKPLAEQVMVVTGASSGIGLLIATGAAAAGAKVLLVARDIEALENIRQDILGAGGTAEVAAADVGDANAMEAVAERAVTFFGQIDTWVNNAGVAIYARLLDTPEDEHERLFRTNYFGVVHGCKAAVPHLQTQGGALITVASIASDMPSPVLGAYTASKHAVKAYVESLRIELMAESTPVSVTLVKPSGMATPIGIHAANHQDGEPLVPPPAYDPQLVADAVLRCAVRPQREVTVGGIGRAQVLFAEHFPALFERLAPGVIPFLANRRLPTTAKTSLWSTGNNGHARSPNESRIPISPYTTLALHPKARAAALAVTTVAAAYLWLRAGRQSPRQS